MRRVTMRRGNHCPLRPIEGYIECEGAECAWWIANEEVDNDGKLVDNGQCSIAHIAEGLEALHYLLQAAKL